ncbi:NlpC/P60 family protein [Robiginitalea sp. M366]|uniref:C40 family peptidase n=1 Tax=Robiginitalea aestuariiviva TaxID=3036903 RepID=UPI00240DB4D4|nr:NlpC/P60 family protein [Robiginitalea aestuariiviva]MDG1572640.1 NlpC/P60 family protein [Robiginitalea aestuariiviva]
MRYGICPLSLVAVYESPEPDSGLTTQLLYGEAYKVLDTRKKGLRIRTEWDGCEGWIRPDQHFEIPEEAYPSPDGHPKAGRCSDLVGHAATREGLLLPVLLGSEVGRAPLLGQHFEGEVFADYQDKENLIPTALLYLNSPELRGGRSPFGIDAGGFAQMVYKCCGTRLSRYPHEQATQGEALSFIEESNPGDLAFFDGPDGTINHVGIIMRDNYIIHAFGKVRIDRLDHSGIFNNELRNYTHPLRVIKKIL